MAIALVDINSMYCSAEQIFRPDLRGRPVAVASNGDGIVVACNRPAKAIGVKKFRSVMEQRHFFDTNKCALFSSNYELYDALSHRFISCIENAGLAQRIERYSIDEAFCEVPSFLTSYEDQLSVARQLRRIIWDHVRLPSGVGIGRNFTIAKLASFIGKNITGYRGLCVICKDNEPELLSLVPVAEIWNVGRARSAFLQKQGVITALDLRRVEPQKARDWFGIGLERTVRELRGETVYTMNSFPDINNRKEVSSSISLTVRAVTELSLHQALSQRISIAAEKLRKLGLTARQMTLFAQSSQFESNPKSYSVTLVFEYPSDDTRYFLKGLSQSIKQLYRENIAFYKIGCRLFALEQTKHQQRDLFEPPAKPKLMQAMDTLNARFGYQVVSLGSVKVENEATMLRKHLSPNYLSNWKDLPKVKC